MPRYRLVIFDFDGTLADSAPWFLGELADLAATHGFRQVSLKEIEMLRGRPSREIVRYFGIRWWRLPAIARDMRRRSAAAAASIPMFEGAAELLARLKAAGVTLAIVSSNGEETVRAVLGPAAGRIDHFHCGAAMFGKARALDQLRRRLRLPREAVLCVGDEVRDIEAARKAGLASGAAAWGYANEAALAAAGPTLRLPDLEAVAQAVL
jgi:phosphoglycolate phosphatase